jgi:hypothetical protein
VFPPIGSLKFLKKESGWGGLKACSKLTFWSNFSRTKIKKYAPTKGKIVEKVAVEFY